MLNTLELKESLKGINGTDIHICGIGLVEYIIECPNVMVFDSKNNITLLSIDENKSLKEFNIDLNNLNRWEKVDNEINLFFMNNWHINIF